jgi:hypothetical protein
MPLWIELMVSLLIVYGGVVALCLPYLRRRARLRMLEQRHGPTAASTREE